MFLAEDWVMMWSCFGFLFVLVLEKSGGHRRFFAIMQLIRTRRQAESFAYRLERNRHWRRLTWEATPRSIHEGITTAIMNSDCLVFVFSLLWSRRRYRIHQASAERLRKSFYPQTTRILKEDTA